MDIQHNTFCQTYFSVNMVYANETFEEGNEADLFNGEVLDRVF